MTIFPMNADDNRSLEELFKPLSAKQQPKRLRKNSFGDPITEEQAIAKQRSSINGRLIARVKLTRQGEIDKRVGARR